ATDALNTLLGKRYKSGTYIPFTDLQGEEGLQIILKERRKELLMRGLRWIDIKRLNKEGGNIVLKREIGGQSYSLQPNANYYALPLPADVIKASGIPQNER
ncbi:MAG: RagB/SusD family nutrient uptake outer membrane protein, partial [Ginsengibacter sp.]